MFEHVPLDDAETQIRLLRLGPGTGSDPIELSVATFQLQNAPEYFAISYAWGVEDIPMHVILDGSKFSVRLNCWYALSQVRYHYPGCSLWIDSICINQSDLEEKSHQVAMMYDIFAAAAKVFACVGPHADGSEILDRTCDGSNHASSVATDDAWSAFSRRPYWSRLWVVQEIAAAVRRGEGNLLVMCGQLALPWRKVAEAVPPLGRDWQSLRVISDCTRSIGLRDVFRNFKFFECSNVLDRLYSLLRLVTSSASARTIRVDYTKSPWDLAMDVCQALPPDSYTSASVIETLRIEWHDIGTQEALRARSQLFSMQAQSSKQAIYTYIMSAPARGPRAIFYGRVENDALGQLSIPRGGKPRSAYLPPGFPRDLKDITKLAGVNEVDTLVALKAISPKPVFSASTGQSALVWLCADARVGDVLYSNPCYAWYDVEMLPLLNSILVLRCSDVNLKYEVVGYGIAAYGASDDDKNRDVRDSRWWTELNIPCSDRLLFASCARTNASNALWHIEELSWTTEELCLSTEDTYERAAARLAQSLWWSPVAGSTARLGHPAQGLWALENLAAPD